MKDNDNISLGKVHS